MKEPAFVNRLDTNGRPLLHPSTAGFDINALTEDTAPAPISDLEPQYDSSASANKKIQAWRKLFGRAAGFVFDECFWQSSAQIWAGGVVEAAAGTGAGTSARIGAASHPGAITLSTGTTSSGRCGLFSNQHTDAVELGGGKVRFGCVLWIPVLSTGTQRFTARMGFADAANVDATDGVYFRYVDNVNSGKWERVTRDNGAETAGDTGVTASNAGYQLFEFEVNAAGTSVEFFIDGTSVGSNASNIPDGRATGLLPANLVKSVGSTASLAHVDAYFYIFEFSTPR